MPEGFGTCGAHFGEVLQGAFRDREEALRPALVTLPAPGFRSQARFTSGGEGVRVRSACGDRRSFEKVLRAVEGAAARWSPDGKTGGEVLVSGGVPRGWGMGSSTGEVVAALRAVAAAFGARPSEAELARLAVRAEGASDPLMFDLAAASPLFDGRRGETLEEFGPLPPLLVVGFNAGPPEGVATDDLAPLLYGEQELRLFESLRARLARALREGDAGTIGKVATQSARINARHRPLARFPEAVDLAHRSGACGVSVAHSGTVIGLLFDPFSRESDPDAAASRLREVGREVVRFRTDGGQSGGPPEAQILPRRRTRSSR